MWSHPVEVVSEYSGIGALEHGLEVISEGLRKCNIQATELDSTAAGRHASAVLRRFLCNVLNPDERKVQPYPASTRMKRDRAVHGALPAEHQQTAMEDRAMLERYRANRTVAQRRGHRLRNVPAFLKVLEGQDRSSYAMWIEGIEQAGFTEHAYVTLPTACGDLHHRTRLLSVHTRGCFHLPL